ncbi:MAG: hypothetical protein ABR509_05990 [Candidatus Limnocylindria bacterium]
MTPVRRVSALIGLVSCAAIAAAACTPEVPTASGTATATAERTAAATTGPPTTRPDATGSGTGEASPTPATGWEGTVFNRPDPPASISALATNDALVVAAGGSATEGAIWILRPNADWERATSVPATPEGEIISLTDVAAVDEGFAAVGVVGAPQGEPFASVIWVSADGRRWREVRRVSGQLLHGVAAGRPGMIAVGGDGPAVGYPNGVAIWMSSDGATWTEVTGLEPLGASAFDDVRATESGLLAVGQSRDDPSGADISAAVWTSPDGTTWTRVSSGPLFAASVMYAVAVGGPGFVAVGQDYGPAGGHPVVWISADGTAWERPSFDVAAGSLNGVAGLDGSVAAVGSIAGTDDLHPALWLSPDGTSWSSVSEVPEQGTGFLDAVVPFGDRVIAAGSIIGPGPDETRPLVITGPLP